jgi:uncharacterized protein YjbI with pentapeptide repeats
MKAATLQLRELEAKLARLHSDLTVQKAQSRIDPIDWRVRVMRGDKDLRSADLSGADLHFANLYEADLRAANLSGAVLRYASLYEADLRGVIGLTCGQLQKAMSWESAYRDPELACGAGIPQK